MNGFVVLHRDAFDHPLLRDADRFRAWFWLISNACWKPTKTIIKGEIIELDRGDLTFSQRFLAEKWGWSKSRVDRFMSDLRDHGMIETRTKNGAIKGHAAGQGQAVISICNYAKYQDVGAWYRGNDTEESGAMSGQQRGNSGAKKNKGTIKPVEEDNPLPPLNSALTAFPKPEWADPQIWADFLQNRKSKRLSNTATAHKRFLTDIAALTDAQWPPGQLLELIVARGWGAAYDPRPKQGLSNDRTSYPSRDYRDGFAAALDDRLEELAERAPGETGRFEFGDSGTDRVVDIASARAL